MKEVELSAVFKISAGFWPTWETDLATRLSETTVGIALLVSVVIYLSLYLLHFRATN